MYNIHLTDISILNAYRAKCITLRQIKFIMRAYSFFFLFYNGERLINGDEESHIKRLYDYRLDFL